MEKKKFFTNCSKNYIYSFQPIYLNSLKLLNKSNEFYLKIFYFIKNDLIILITKNNLIKFLKI